MAKYSSSEQYANNLLAGLNLSGLKDPKRQEVLDMLTQRLDEVIFNTTVRLLPEEFKVPYIQACMDPEKNEEKIMDITSQVPELAESLEAALLYEYEGLKYNMSEK